MKLLRNPVVVGILALLAVAMVFNSLRPMLHRGGTPSPSENPVPAAAPTEVQNAAPAPSQLTEPRDPGSVGHTDWSALSNSYAHWTDAPKRDPFHIRNGGTNEVSDTRLLLILNAVWRSSAGTLAVINNQVVGQGDSILGYRIESIEPDGVWVLGPNGREEIYFKLVPQPAQSDFPATSPAGPNSSPEKKSP